MPFGPSDRGVTVTWLNGQHYYTGLADDMDLGLKYTQAFGAVTVDIGYYYSDEGTFFGHTNDSSRYSYDVVNESGQGYEERNQFNLRAIYDSFTDGPIPTALGFSAQFGQLDSQGPQDDGHHHAVSIHMINTWHGWTLASQLTYYRYEVDTRQPLGTDTRVQIGAFDFPNTLAAKGTIPAISLRYLYDTPQIPWLDSIMPYVEFSSIIKQEGAFNNSHLFITGAAWQSGGWYIFTEWAYSNGAEFVGSEAPSGDRLGANADPRWQYHFNINLGYYF